MLHKIFAWMDPATLLAAIWRAAVAVLDWRTHLRRLTGRPVVDVVFVTNMRDETDRRRYLGSWRPKSGHFNGPRYWLNGKVVGRTRALDVVTEDLTSSDGKKRAQELFIDATRWAKKNGAKVILLAAGTKRLFGEDGARLKTLFPDLTFTIGDNGTMFLLREETFRALEEAKLNPSFCKIGVLGPYGFLGEMIVGVLIEKGYVNIIGIGSNIHGLRRVHNEYGIKVCQNLSEMGQVDVAIACTHSEKVRLNAETIELIRRSGRKLLVIDVAEPSNLKHSEFLKCESVVIRQDAGNAHNPGMKYVLGAISYRMFRLSQGVTFGCFAEAMSLAVNKKLAKEARV